jgi:DNA-binding MarR family transcriptional regulator
MVPVSAQRGANADPASQTFRTVYFDIIETFDRVERTTASPADPIERALAGYAQIVQLMSAARSPEFPDPSVTMAQMRVLMLLSAVGEARMSDVAHQLGISPSTLSSLVDRLVESHFVSRRDDARDRRSVLVSLAPAGNQLLDQFNELGAGALRELLEQIDAKDIVTVNKAIELLVAAARRLTPEDPR